MTLAPYRRILADNEISFALLCPTEPQTSDTFALRRGKNYQIKWPISIVKPYVSYNENIN